MKQKTAVMARLDDDDLAWLDGFLFILGTRSAALRLSIRLLRQLEKNPRLGDEIVGLLKVLKEPLTHGFGAAFDRQRRIAGEHQLPLNRLLENIGRSK